MDASPSFRERFLRNICQYDFVMYLAFVVEVILLLFALMSYLFADLDKETETILTIDFLLLGTTFAVTVGFIYICSRRR